MALVPGTLVWLAAARGSTGAVVDLERHDPPAPKPPASVSANTPAGAAVRDRQPTARAIRA